MQVKKFEARSMKEALEMVKTQMGPDAIILSVRDNNKSFGLVGEGSVEITAAVSDQTLQKKKFAESKMTTERLTQYNRSTAKVQRSIIDKVVNNHNDKKQPPKPITSRRYIDIDEGIRPQDVAPLVSAPVGRSQNNNDRNSQQYEGLSESQATRQLQTNTRAQEIATQQQSFQNQQAAQVQQSETEVKVLKQEIVHLREMIAQFKTMPQNVISSHPGADYGIPYDLSHMFQRLTGSGVAPEIAAHILVKAQETIPALKMKNSNLVDGCARHLLESTPVVQDRHSQKIHCFVGPSGGGKTTAMVKYASELLIKEKKKVALITTDTFKVGAAEQMRTYAQILNVPFAVVRSTSDWNAFMKYLSEIDVALVDFPGWSLKSQDEVEKFNQILPPQILNPRFHFVLSATAKDGDILEATKRYSILGIDDAIFTGLDISVQHGNIYNLTQRAQIPLHSFGIGTHVPDDFEAATRERMLDLIFKITEEPVKWMELR